jgi:hypothetical protein
MVALRFHTDAVRRQCCDLRHMRERWGPEVARSISRRLQQIEAMSTLDDLAFLPFDSNNHADGLVRVMITPELALAIRPTPEATEGEPTMPSVTVTHVLAVSPAARKS